MNDLSPRFPDGPPQDPNYAWFHIIITTYGAWLDGDERGFRTRHHREHIEGDYKNPPPRERYAARRQRSRSLLKQPPVFLAPRWRPILGQAVVERFQSLGAFVLCAAAASQHVHLLAKLPDGKAKARAWSGLAKKHAWFIGRDHGWEGKMWAHRGKELPVLSQRHQRNVYYYILGHVDQGAWVWKWERPEPESAPPPSPGVAPPGEEAPPE